MDAFQCVKERVRSRWIMAPCVNTHKIFLVTGWIRCMKKKNNIEMNYLCKNYIGKLTYFPDQLQVPINVYSGLNHFEIFTRFSNPSQWCELTVFCPGDPSSEQTPLSHCCIWLCWENSDRSSGRRKPKCTWIHRKIKQIGTRTTAAMSTLLCCLQNLPTHRSWNIQRRLRI